MPKDAVSGKAAFWLLALNLRLPVCIRLSFQNPVPSTPSARRPPRFDDGPHVRALAGRTEGHLLGSQGLLAVHGSDVRVHRAAQAGRQFSIPDDGQCGTGRTEQ